MLNIFNIKKCDNAMGEDLKTKVKGSSPHSCNL